MDRYLQYTIAAVLSLFCICLCMFWSDAEPWRAFGEHGLVETVAMGVAVFGIDQLQKRREDLRLLPRQRAAHTDIRLILDSVVRFWTMAYLASVPESEGLPKNLSELFTPEVLRRKVGIYLSLSAKPPVAPERTWGIYWLDFLQETRDNASTALTRHAGVLDPEAYADLHELFSSLNDPRLVLALRQVRGGVAAPVLGGELVLDDDRFCGAILRLVKWLNEEAARIELEQVATVNRMAVTVDARNRPTTPPAMANAEIVASLKAQYAEQDRAQSRS